MQVGDEKVPVLLVENATIPVGVIVAMPEPSATVAVQVLGVLSSTLAGEHETVVALTRIVEVTTKVPLLPEWLASPL